MISRVINLLNNDDGTTAVEYCVLLALIVMGVIGAVGTFGAETGGLWGGINDDLSSTTFGGGS